MRYFIKQAVIGIPDRKVKSAIPLLSTPQQWEFVIQEHKADKAGLHYDFRLGQGLSWAGRRLPEPGEKQLFIRQPDHDVSYYDFSGTIPEGYGKGEVSVKERGKVEVLKSAPDKITFNYYKGSATTKYSMIHMSGDDWLLVNHSKPSQEVKKIFPEPLKYKSEYSPKEGDISTPKIDGASAVMILRGGKTPLVYSRRISKRTGELIEYTPKITTLLNTIVPGELKTTVLRTEVYGATPDNKELPNRTLSGILNAGVEQSRVLQRKHQAPLRVAAYDIVKYKGKDVEDIPYEQKQLLIKDIRTKFPYIDIPSEVEKQISFKEGRVVWRNNVPYKVKTVNDYDVYVRDVFESLNKERAGGFTYSFTPKGKVKGKVGTGFKHKELKDMRNHPNKYIGMIARVVSQQKHPSGALRVPAFKGWHMEKNQ